MKIVFEFDDQEPDEKDKVKRMFLSEDVLHFIFEFEQHLRSKYKYGEPSKDIEDLWNDWHRMKPEAVHLLMETY